MGEKQDFHIKADKALKVKAQDLSGLTNREIFELGCKAAIEQNQNRLDIEIMELHEAEDKVDELTTSIRKRLRNMEVPTRPDPYNDDENEIRRNTIPLDLLKEMMLYYMDEYNISDISEMQKKNSEIFKFLIINLNHHNLKMDEINDLYEDINSE